MEHGGRTREQAKALTKGLDVLEALAGAARVLTLVELSRALGLPKATVHRIAGVLEARGYLERDGRSGGYRLGLKVWQLGSRAVGPRRLRDVARPFLEDLARQTEEHVNLAVLDGPDAVFVDIIESSKPIRTYTELGGRVPGYCSATGKAILAFQPEAVIAALLRGRLQAFTDRTIVQPVRLRRELELVARQGYALNREEWREDVCGLAAPVRNHTSAVVASVSVTTPASRFDERAFRPRVIACAEGVSRALGWLVPSAESPEHALRSGDGRRRAALAARGRAR